MLLHEHELRIGNYASAFSLSGMGVRMAQALQINLESSLDILCLQRTGLSVSTRETRRRLMWSVYAMDAWVGSGVDELTMIRDAAWKLVHFVDTEEGQLFDMQADPQELHNLWDDPAHTATKRALIDEILKWRIMSDLKTQGWTEALTGG